MFAQSINIDGLDQQSMYFIGTAIAGIVTIVVNFQVKKLLLFCGKNGHIVKSSETPSDILFLTISFSLKYSTIYLFMSSLQIYL